MQRPAAALVRGLFTAGRSPRRAEQPPVLLRAPYIQFTAALLPGGYFGASGRQVRARRHARLTAMERRRRPSSEPMAKAVRRRDRPRERWLLTRKTWKYMSDAGRRLVPDGAQNRAEDVPRIEAYFQEVCAREPRFLLWRKSSYPSALPRPRRKKRPRGGSVRARSPPDEAPPRPTELLIGHTSGGRFDLAKLRRDFFATPPPTPAATAFSLASKAPGDDDEGALVDLLRKYLKVEDDKIAPRITDAEELVLAIRRYLKRQTERSPADSDSDPARRALLDTLGKYYTHAPNRDNSVQDLLSDRSLLKRLYQDLRKTKPYRGGRSGGTGGAGGFGAGGYSGVGNARSAARSRVLSGVRIYDGEDGFRSPPMSPPPLIEVISESLEDKFCDRGTQTVPIPEEVLCELERAYREKLEAATAPTSPTSPPPERKPARRRSSVDHDDVSQSVSDTIKRYLRMARKKSVDSEKVDRFKRINYDKNLRNIKPRVPGEVDDDGPHKGCQTEEGWILTYRDLHFASVASTPTSPPSPTQSHSFLSALLGRGVTTAPPAGGMQKSRSSSSVVQSVSKRLWRTRSRSSSRVSATWTPQGSCCWADGSGRCVRLADTSLLTLSEVERRALQQAALARLQQINLGTAIKIPEENSAATVATKPKRRAYLLKRKALTTGFFDQSRTKDGDKDKEPAGSVFGVPLAQCVEMERALRRQQHGGSRASLASLGALEKGDDSESCDSGEWGWSGLDEAGGGGPKVPGLVSACLAHLRRHGLRTLGLFRVSASKKRVRQLREEWERAQDAALDSAVCPHDVATLLKEFLRDLPDPLLCRDLYPAFLQTQKIRNRRLQWEAMRLIVQLLPAAHRDTLNALLTFLAQLASHAEDDAEPGNKMDAANLATIFAPNILHRNKPNEAASAEQLSERADVINVVRQLVERQAELWTLPAELLHEAYIHLAHSAPAILDSLLLRRAECAAESVASSAGGVGGAGGVGNAGGAAVPGAAEGATRRVWSREQFLHGAAATAAPASTYTATHAVSEKSYSRSRRSRDAASDTSSGSLSSAMTIITRVRSSDECVTSGVVCSPSAPRADSAPDSNDSASDYNETGVASEDECVITASLHIPVARARRRSASGSSSSAKRDSAVGSSSASATASGASSPPASPPPKGDIDRLGVLARERNTSDARAVVLRQRDATSRSRQAATAATATATATATTTATATLYKRNELISSARTPPA
ncbi:unnamed protein product, partial [Iphiclides podalirius]